MSQFMVMRDKRIDSMKGFLILLVVIGHMLEQHFASTTNLIVYLIIYSFHMPLFVMISGYLFKPSQSFEKLWRSSLLLFESFIVFQLIFCIMIWRDNGYCNFDPINLIIPHKILWYIVSLIVWRIASYLLYKLIQPKGRNLVMVFVIAVVIALIAGFIPLGNEFAFQRTCVFFPMFLIGNLLKTESSWNALKPSILWGGVIISVVLGVIAYCVTDIDVMRWSMYSNQTYETSKFIFYPPLEAMLRRLLFMALGISLAMTIFVIYPSTNILSFLGEATLIIYLLHTFMISFLNYHITDSSLPLYIYALAITGILYLLSKTRIAPYLTNPITSVIKLNSYFLK